MRTGTPSNRRPKWPKISCDTCMWPVLRHWWRASRIESYKMILSLTACIVCINITKIVSRLFRYNMVGLPGSVFDWSRTFQISRIIFHDLDAAPATSQPCHFQATFWPWTHLWLPMILLDMPLHAFSMLHLHFPWKMPFFNMLCLCRGIFDQPCPNRVHWWHSFWLTVIFPNWSSSSTPFFQGMTW